MSTVQDSAAELAVVSDASSGSLADRAYQDLRRRILDSQLPPGAPLSVPALARTLNISRSPVREAVQRLIHDGLATHAPNRGAEVARLEISELIEIYVVKEPLMGLTARLAATRLTQQDVEVLRAMIAEQEAALEVDTHQSQYMAMDVSFHGLINRAAGNTALLSTLAQFETRTSLAFPSAWSEHEYARLSVREHRAIADALIAGDADDAERASAAHVRNVRNRLARWHGTSGS
ncbi:GntR family transcriptional regulator [Dietzia sp. PP-33]|jgi:DNA-binding GntR family transcriptional regulator|uniref:GntR family transcriptional regulator n=1 Tax=Dietzia sp. PP-33 TaxID=2957500 RepID=UPI0029A7F5D8|nr:GntR family transcriptional regulator [Dietzia sp. PP-33]MDX2358743.1 GntR family transcriptional regulator [Dietzia sp. PP-33]